MCMGRGEARLLKNEARLYAAPSPPPSPETPPAYGFTPLDARNMRAHANLARLPAGGARPAALRAVDALHRLVHLGDAAAPRLGAGAVRPRQAQSPPVVERGAGGHRGQHAGRHVRL